jgi:hypothetical protein
MRRPLALLALVLALPATAACVDDASVTVKLAEGYTPGPASVSVLGVFRDGRMSIDTWIPMAPLVSTALGAATADVCEPAYGEQLQHEHEDVFSTFDRDVRDNGITADLLTRMEPHAQGDFILTISVHGTVGQTSEAPKASSQQQGRGASPPQSMRGAGGTGRNRGAMGGNVREAPARGPGLRPVELSASLYSIRLHAPVARLKMLYSGQSADEALRRFAAEVSALAPGSKCKGWSWPKDLPASVAPLLDGP